MHWEHTGVGIPAVDRSRACLPSATSKIRSDRDIEGVTTYGFRGEALASLAALGDVKITTATKDEAVSYGLHM